MLGYFVYLKITGSLPDWTTTEITNITFVTEDGLFRKEEKVPSDQDFEENDKIIFQEKLIKCEQKRIF